MDYGTTIAYATGGAAFAAFITGWMVGGSDKNKRLERLSREIIFLKDQHKLEVQYLNSLLVGIRMGQKEEQLSKVIEAFQREERARLAKEEDRLVAEGKLIRFTS